MVVDLGQVLLILVITVLTILLSVIGIQIIYILREIRRSLEKINQMLDDAKAITESIIHPLTGLGGMVDGMRSIGKAIETIGVFMARRKKSKSKSAAEE